VVEWGTITRTCREKAVQILKERAPEGLRFKDLVDAVLSTVPSEFSRSQVAHAIWPLDRVYPEIIKKPARGVFRYGMGSLSEELGGSIASPIGGAASPDSAERPSEREFYEPFAKFLKGEDNLDLDECTEAIPIGEMRVGGKWGNPDVIGVYRSRVTDIIKEEPVIVSAEIKVDNGGTQLITGFGQACSYRLFSHKVYFVIPNDVEGELETRIESLCQIFGIGLVLFNRKNKDEPDWEIRLRAVRSEPDLFYLNQYLSDAGELARKLFP
jgi:hypothetical protein